MRRLRREGVRQVALRRERERRELYRLLVLCRNSELVGKGEAKPGREEPLETLHEIRVADAPAAGNESVDFTENRDVISD